MIRHAFGLVAALVAWAAAAAPGQGEADSLVERHWFEARTAYFHIYSCGPTQEVARVVARLEQFREAYSILAGAQAVASPPIVVMAFPDRRAMQPFLPLYEGKPANLTAFFHRGSDQNLIVLPLSGRDAGSLRIIYHEYTHLLLRHNQAYWPLWLGEGMAEIYATFEVQGGHRASIGNPIEHHLRLLEQEPLMPLKKLFAVTRNSPEYNESEQQGIFYAESWLLTHYLMLGNNSATKVSFRQLTPLLRQGQTPEQAFTNALHTSLPAMETQLRHYLARGEFAPAELSISANLDTPRAFVKRGITPSEVCYRLGDELLHLGRLEAAEAYFLKAKKLAPGSPLPYEGLGQLAAWRGKPEEAVRFLRQAKKCGRLSFLGHFICAREQYLLAVGGPRPQTLAPAIAAEIQAELQNSLAQMPDFGPSHQLLGVFEMLEGENLPGAEKQIARAIQLEPENQAYVLSLAQIQMAKRDPAAARRTLAPLRLPYVQAEVRAHAEEMLKGLNGGSN